MIGVKNSSHPGSIASIMLKVAQKGYIGLGSAHADSLMLTHKGRKPFFEPIQFVSLRQD